MPASIKQLASVSPLLAYRKAERVVQQERLGAGHHQRAAIIRPSLLLTGQHPSADLIA